MKDLQKINGIYLGEITSIAEDNTKIKVKIPQFHNDIKDPESLPESYICSPMSVSNTSGVFIPSEKQKESKRHKFTANAMMELHLPLKI